MAERGLPQLWHVGLAAPCLWSLPRPGIEPMSPALADRLLTTGTPGKSRVVFKREWVRKSQRRPWAGGGDQKESRERFLEKDP